MNECGVESACGRERISLALISRSHTKRKQNHEGSGGISITTSRGFLFFEFAFHSHFSGVK